MADDGWRYLYALGTPILLAIIWGTFAVPNDPSRSGAAPVPIPGPVRLILELAIFGFGTFALYEINHSALSLVLGSAILIHYGLSHDRILWLLKRS